MSIVHDRRDGHILVKPEHGRRVTMENLIALATMPVLFDVGTDLSYVTHRILEVSD